LSPCTAELEDIAPGEREAEFRDDLEVWRESPSTAVLINGDVGILRMVAELVLGLFVH